MIYPKVAVQTYSAKQGSLLWVANFILQSTSTNSVCVCYNAAVLWVLFWCTVLWVLCHAAFAGCSCTIHRTPSMDLVPRRWMCFVHIEFIRQHRQPSVSVAKLAEMSNWAASCTRRPCAVFWACAMPYGWFHATARALAMQRVETSKTAKNYNATAIATH